jgi:NAD(P)-dependent dehydrogenase (short-subunit alcohol dehydrogenase family)
MHHKANNHQLLNSPYIAAVIGATGAIGAAFVDQLLLDPHCTHVEMISRAHCSGFDLLDPASIQAQAQVSSARGPFSIIIDATGVLTIQNQGPEKSLASVNAEQLLHSLQLNTIGPAMVLRCFAPLLARGPAIYAKLSARVGSIADNKKGGWYGYRASKAAFNMVLHTAAIELQRKNPELRVVALQPGTVRSNLSLPFAHGVSHLLEPAESVSGMLAALRMLPARAGAHFIDYKGEDIPW